MSTLPVKAEQQQPPATVPHAGYSIADLDLMAERFAASRLFPGIESKQAAFALMMLCQSEGLHPAQAMRRYHIIEGRPSMRADAMQAEFQRQGGRVVWGRSDAELCEATFAHPQHAPDGVTIRVTFAELDKAGVTRGFKGIKDNWRKFPRHMLRARCISEGVRMVLPGVVCGIYTPEEVSDFTPTFQPAPASFPNVVAAPEPHPVASQERWERLLDKCVARWEEAHPAEDPDESYDRRNDIIAHVVQEAVDAGKVGESTGDDEGRYPLGAVALWEADEAWTKATALAYLRSQVTPGPTPAA